MVMFKPEQARRVGFIVGGGIALLIGAATVLTNVLDILWSKRLSYGEFQWSSIHHVAVALLHLYVPFSQPALLNPLYWLASVGVAVGCFVFLVGLYYLLIGCKFPTAEIRRRSLVGFLLGFLVMSVGVALIGGMMLFALSVLRFGFV